MLGQNLDNQGLYIGKPEESNGTILLENLDLNKDINTLKVGNLGVGRAIHRNNKK